MTSSHKYYKYTDGLTMSQDTICRYYKRINDYYIAYGPLRHDATYWKKYQTSQILMPSGV